MARLAASEHALVAVLSLSQRPDGFRISEIAAILGASFSGAERALEILVDDGLAARRDHRYRLVDSPRAHEAVRFALAFLDVDRALLALARGNDAVEFCGLGPAGALIVLRRFAEPRDEARLREAVALLAGFHADMGIEIVRKEELRDTLGYDLGPRRRAAELRVLAGSIERTFPDRTRHGEPDAPSLGSLHPSLRGPSLRRMRSLARRFGLRRIAAFGSATRVDFRPDSDVDLFVEPAPGRRLGLDDRIDLTVEAERIFERDVDLVVAPIRRPSLVDRIRREAVALYDATR